MTQFTVITAKPVNIQAMMDRVISGVEDTIKDAEQDFQKAIRTWRDKPKFAKTFKRSAQFIEGEISSDNAVLRFVSGGTRVRYATMTPGFVAKTVPGWIGSRPGQGGMLFINKRRPRPGIKARGFDKTIAKKLAPYFFRRMMIAMQQAAQVSGHAIK